MSGRRASKRERRKPELFGSFGAGQEEKQEWEPEQHPASEEEEEEEEEQPRKRARRQRRRAPDSEEEEEEAGAAPAAATGQKRGGGGKRAARQPRKQAQREASEPLPPAQPLSRGDFLGALHACPTLIDMILQQDGLRTPTLLARDAANLAVALCASAEQMDGAWRTLAARAAGGEGFAGSTAEALAAAQAAVKGDPARTQRCTTTTAKQDYRLSDKDLGGLDYVTRDNPIFWSAAPTRLYRVLDCLAIAHRKYGDLAGIQAAKAKAQERGQKVKATRQGNTQRRKQEMDAAMKEEGLNAWRYRKHADVTGFIKHGRGTAAEVAAALKKAEEAEADKVERRQKLVQRLDKEGLGGLSEWQYLPAVVNHIAGEGKATQAAAVAAVKKEKAARDGRAERTKALRERLEQEGLLNEADRPSYYTPDEYLKYYIPGASSYIAKGEGSIDGIVEAVVAQRKEKADKEAAAQQRAQEVAERRGRALEVLEAAGIQWEGRDIFEVVVLADFVYRGEGSEEGLVPAVQAHLQREAQREERQAHVRQLLEGAGLGEMMDFYIQPLNKYIQTGEGDDASLLAAARAQRQRRDEAEQRTRAEVEAVRAQREAFAARRARVAKLLSDNGLPYFYIFSVASIAYYVDTGEGSDAAALADAKKHHASKPHTQLLAELMANAGAAAAGGAGGAAAGGGAAAAGDAAGAGGGAAAAAAAAGQGPMLW